MSEQYVYNQNYPMNPNLGKITRFQEVPITVPEQRQLRQPGLESLMHPRPIIENPNYTGTGKLLGKAVFTGQTLHVNGGQITSS